MNIDTIAELVATTIPGTKLALAGMELQRDVTEATLSEVFKPLGLSIKKFENDGEQVNGYCEFDPEKCTDTVFTKKVEVIRAGLADLWETNWKITERLLNEAVAGKGPQNATHWVAESYCDYMELHLISPISMGLYQHFKLSDFEVSTDYSRGGPVIMIKVSKDAYPFGQNIKDARHRTAAPAAASSSGSSSSSMFPPAKQAAAKNQDLPDSVDQPQPK